MCCSHARSPLAMRVAFWTSCHARSSAAMGVDSVNVAMRVALFFHVAMRVPCDDAMIYHRHIHINNYGTAASSGDSFAAYVCIEHTIIVERFALLLSLALSPS